MADITGDLADIAGRRGNGVAVLRSTAFRPAVRNGGAVVPDDHRYNIVNGILEMTGLDPGPALIHIRMGRFSKKYLINIPDSETPSDLVDLIQQFEELPPPVVSQAWQAAQAAIAARGESIEAAAISVGMAELADRRAGDAGESATVAGQHAGDATDAAGAANEHRRLAVVAAEDADQARQAAQAAAAEAVTVVDGRTSWSGSIGLAATQVAVPAYFKRTLTGNTTVTFPAGAAGKVYTVTLDIKQDAAGGRALSLSGVKWPDAAAVLRVAPGAHDVIHVMWNGEEWLAMVAGQGFVFVAGGGA